MANPHGPTPALAFRIEADGKSLAYASDAGYGPAGVTEEVVSLCRGADQVILLSDRKFAGADTQATSYTLKCAIDKVGSYDMVFCGRQAIDGDTAQVGPGIACRLGVSQLTLVEEISKIEMLANDIDKGLAELKTVADARALLVR